MFLIIVKLFLVGLIPVVISIFLRYLDKCTKFKTMFSYWQKQLIFGLIFGALSALCSELSVKTQSGLASINIRDAAPIIAGLIFGAPAGIISGVIGGLERFLSVYWGGGMLTRVACSVSTMMAGVFAGLIRYCIFDGHHGRWYYGLISGIVIESFHMLMVFATNMDNISTAFDVVKDCSWPMIIANALVITIAMIGVSFVNKEPLFDYQKPLKIEIKLQRNLASAIIFALLVVEGFNYMIFDSQSNLSTATTIKIGIQDVINEVNEASDKNMLDVTKIIRDELDATDEADYDTTLVSLMKQYNVSEISIIDYNDKIIYSTKFEYVSFDMNTGAQSREFACLNNEEESYVQSYGPISRDSSVKMKYAGYAFKNSFGYVQVGYDAERFHKDIDSEIIGIAKNRHIGVSGWICIYNENGELLTGPDSFTPISANIIKQLSLDTINRLSDFDKSVSDDQVIYATNIEGYIITGTLPYDEVKSDMMISIYITIFLETIVFFMLYCIIFLLLRKKLINKLENVNHDLQKITNGDLNVIVNEHSSKELSLLSNDVNSTVNTLKDYISREAQKIESELLFAKSIQLSALPSTFPPYPNIKEFEIYAMMKTAKEVGGDFYDFYMLGNDKLVFLIADVSGKGVPAAMFMMKSKSIIKSMMETGLEIGDAITKANNKICEGNDAQMFVTCWIGILDIKTGLVKFVNAGHNPPLISKGNGDFSYIKSKVGLVLGAMDGVIYKTQELQLEDGDQLFLYTDGVTEATNINKELYAEERLNIALNESARLTSEYLCNSILDKVNEFVDGAEQADDITMLSLKFVGKKEMKNITVKSKIENVAKILSSVDEFLESIDCPMKINNSIDLVIDEIASNICYYAYPKDKPGNIHVSIENVDDTITLIFEDNGTPYNPLEKDDPDVTLKLEDRNPGGLGVFVVKKLMDVVEYNNINGRNILIIKKKYK